MTHGLIDNSFLDWASGTGLNNLEFPRSVSRDFAETIGQDIQNSFRMSEYLDKPRRKLEHARREIAGLWHVENNWDSYGAAAPNMIAIEAATLFLYATIDSNLTYAKILPSAEGGAAVAFFNGDKRAIAEFLNDGTSDLMLYDTTGALSDIEPTSGTSQAFLEAIRAYLFGNEDR